MQRRAVVIGAQTGGLLGIGSDLDAMSAMLSARGFAVCRVEGETATRDGILATYRALIEATCAGDAAVVYFSLHGGIAIKAGDAHTDPSEHAPERYQFIVPVDFEESAEGDFRGITALELSALQDELTAKTANVTVVLDCCYASRMSRDGLTPRALPRVQYADIAAHLDRIGGPGLSQRRRNPAGNQSAVRLVAAGPGESAFEYSPKGGDSRVGVFTEALCEALDEVGELPMSWTVLLRDVRERVQILSPMQRPEAEGPSNRLVFGTTVAVADAVPMHVDGDRFSLLGGRICDIDLGDTFAVMPAGSAAMDPAQQVAVVTVTAVTATRADVRVEMSKGAAGLPARAVAFPIGRGNRRYPVEVAGDPAGADPVRAAITRASHVQVRKPGDPEPLATVHVTGDGLTVRDGFGDLTPPEGLDVDGMAAALNRLARAATLRQLGSGEGPEALTSPFEIEVGEVVDGQARAWPAGVPPTVSVNQRLYLRLTNRGPNRLYFFVFDVGVAGEVTLVTNTDPSGIALDRDETHLVGWDEMGRPAGLTLGWPSSLPKDGPRPETLLVIVTTHPQDLGGLQHPGIGAGRGAGRSSLERLAAQVSGGGRRDLQPAPVPTRYAVFRVEWLLHPYPLRGAEVGDFLIDERPDASLRLLSARGRGRPRPPQAVAVRLRKVVVHRNRAWGHADIRLDTLVMTGGDPAIPPALHAHTEQFPRIRDNDRLSLDQLMIFHGPVQDYLDIAVWVTRNRANMLRLTDLLDENLNTAEMQQALATAATMAGAGGQAAVAAAAIGATAKIVDVAYRLLSAGVGDSIGVYRNSLLAQERFGVGTHPTSGLLKAQDFSFSYEIIDVKGTGR